MISLENYEDFEEKGLINSPRSLEALKRLGIQPSEIQFKTLEEFSGKNGKPNSPTSMELMKLRFRHNEDKRKQLILKAKKERIEIIRILEQGHNIKPGTFIQPIDRLSHKDNFSESANNGKFGINDYRISQDGSPSSIIKKKQNRGHTQQLSIEQSQAQAFEQLQKQGIIDDNYYKRFALTQQVENKVILGMIDKNVRAQHRASELEKQANSEEVKELLRLEENHLNEFYRTKQKMKREMDAREQKFRDLQLNKQTYKEELEKELDQFYSKKQKKEQELMELEKKKKDSDMKTREKLNSIRQQQLSSIERLKVKIVEIEGKIEQSQQIKDRKKLDKLINKKQENFEKQKQQKERLLKLEEEKMRKQLDLYQKLSIEQELYEKRMLMMANSQKLSDMGNGENNLFDKKERFRMVKQEAEKQQRKKQEELIERMQKVEQSQKLIKEQKEKEMEIKKEQQLLKEKAKEENVKRHQRKLEYKKELYLVRLKQEEQTFNEVRKLKNEVIQERYYNHMIDEIKKHQMKQSVEQMQLKKKFSKKKIQEITHDFQFMTNMNGSCGSNDKQQHKQSMQEDDSTTNQFPAVSTNCSKTNAALFSNQLSPTNHNKTLGMSDLKRGGSQNKLRNTQKHFDGQVKGISELDGAKKLHQALKVIQKNSGLFEISGGLAKSKSTSVFKPLSAQQQQRFVQSQSVVNNINYGQQQDGSGLNLEGKNQRNVYITNSIDQNHYHNEYAS